MKVTQTENRNQRKSYPKYKQTLGKADPIIVRRAVTFPHAVTHPSSRATARQRDRLSRASQYEASISFQDKNLIPFASRLSFVSKPSSKGTAKVLTGRPAIVSQAIRDQQTGNTIEFYKYPCLSLADMAGNRFPFTHMQWQYQTGDPRYVSYQSLESGEFLLLTYDQTRSPAYITTAPMAGFLKYSNPTFHISSISRSNDIRRYPNISVYFSQTYAKNNWWHSWTEDTRFTAILGDPKGMNIYWTTPSTRPGGGGGIGAIVDITILYPAPRTWHYYINLYADIREGGMPPQAVLYTPKWTKYYRLPLTPFDFTLYF